MKQIITILLLMAAMSAKAQDIKLDTASSRYYAEIVPQPVTFLSGSPMLRRVYIGNISFSGLSVSFTYWLMYQDVAAVNTNREWQPIVTATCQRPVSTSSIGAGVFALFEHISDSLVDVEYTK